MRPNQAPPAAPRTAALPLVTRPVTVSTVRTSWPTICVEATGNSRSDSVSTAACASAYSV
ncbi:hypothetical protein BFL35_08305 [Clavibacter michiganensis]|nr:hypothetical protein BFL35_08305 [Clavibacter michiganensis]